MEILLLISFVLLFKVALIVLKQSMRLHFLDVYVNYPNIERKQIIRKHKSTSQIAATWKKEERNLQLNGPREKIRTSFKFF